jgi:hypothetical protein
MYKSPIEMALETFRFEQENNILKAVQNVGINVNKDELIRALQYDRDQYDKGFEDGMECFAALLKDWFVKNSNYWFSHTVNAEIDQLLKERGYSIETTNY